MGDNGKAYRTCTADIQKRMRELAAAADMITPNVTEAAMLTGGGFTFEPLTRSAARSLLSRLSELGPRSVVVTGAELATGELANLGYDREGGSYWYVPCDYVPVSSPAARYIRLGAHRRAAGRSQPANSHEPGGRLCGAGGKDNLQLRQRPTLWRYAGERAAQPFPKRRYRQLQDTVRETMATLIFNSRAGLQVAVWRRPGRNAYSFSRRGRRLSAR